MYLAQYFGMLLLAQGFGVESMDAYPLDELERLIRSCGSARMRHGIRLYSLDQAYDALTGVSQDFAFAVASKDDVATAFRRWARWASEESLPYAVQDGAASRRVRCRQGDTAPARRDYNVTDRCYDVRLLLLVFSREESHGGCVLPHSSRAELQMRLADLGIMPGRGGLVEKVIPTSRAREKAAEQLRLATAHNEGYASAEATFRMVFPGSKDVGDGDSDESDGEHRKRVEHADIYYLEGVRRQAISRFEEVGRRGGEDVGILKIKTDATAAELVNREKTQAAICSYNKFDTSRPGHKRGTKTTCDLRPVHAGTAAELYACTRAQLVAIGAPSWDENWDDGTLYRFAVIVTDQGRENTGARPVFEAAAAACDVILIFVYCWFHICHLVFRLVIGSVSAGAGRAAGQYQKALLGVIGVWRRAGNPRKVRRAAASLGVHGFEKPPPAVSLTRWGTARPGEKKLWDLRGENFGLVWDAAFTRIRDQGDPENADAENADPETAARAARSLLARRAERTIKDPLFFVEVRVSYGATDPIYHLENYLQLKQAEGRKRRNGRRVPRGDPAILELLGGKLAQIEGEFGALLLGGDAWGDLWEWCLAMQLSIQDAASAVLRAVLQAAGSVWWRLRRVVDCTLLHYDLMIRGHQTVFKLPQIIFKLHI